MERRTSQSPAKPRQETGRETNEEAETNTSASIKNDVAVNKSDAAVFHSTHLNVANLGRILPEHADRVLPRIERQRRHHHHTTYRNASSLPHMVVLAVLFSFRNNIFSHVRTHKRGMIKNA